jgi:hypothetical protein
MVIEWILALKLSREIGDGHVPAALYFLLYYCPRKLDSRNLVLVREDSMYTNHLEVLPASESEKGLESLFSARV